MNTDKRLTPTTWLCLCVFRGLGGPPHDGTPSYKRGRPPSPPPHVQHPPGHYAYVAAAATASASTADPQARYMQQAPYHGHGMYVRERFHQVSRSLGCVCDAVDVSMWWVGVCVSCMCVCVCAVSYTHLTLPTSVAV